VAFKSKLLFSFGLFGLCWILLPSFAKADALVNVGGTKYDITVVTGSYLDVSTSLTGNPWWNNSFLAKSLSNALAEELGTPNNIGNENFAPLFVYYDDGQFYHGWTWEQDIATPLPDSAFDHEPTIHTWALGSIVSTPEPATPIMIFAGLLAFGLLVGRRRALPLRSSRTS
jgi:hypothetical protein